MTDKNFARERVFTQEKKKGLSVFDCVLLGVLLAAGVVLKQVGGAIAPFGMKPNFIIAMYCLAILLIKPRVRDALIVGILAGAVCQINPGTPYLNFISEVVGALAMVLLMAAFSKLNLKINKFDLALFVPAVATFLSTLLSGFTFLGALYLAFAAGFPVKTILVQTFLAIIFGTALTNAVIVQLLYIPLKLTLKR